VRDDRRGEARATGAGDHEIHGLAAGGRGYDPRMAGTYELGSWRHVAGRSPASDFVLDPATTALVVVDLQRKICDRTAARGLGARLRETDPVAADVFFDRLENVVLPNVERLLAAFRERGLTVLHFVVGPNRADALDLPQAFRRLYVQAGGAGDGGAIHAGSPEFEIVPQARPEPGETVVHKLTYGGFTSTGAEGLLRNLGIESLVLVGGNAHVCVEATGRAAADLGFLVTAVEDAVIDYEPLMFDAAMITFASILGRVASTREVIAELGALDDARLAEGGDLAVRQP
jgi:nicotinamidase-related amidase